MGLCKCPKKKVTNQFCFNCKVNVCEYCMTTSHQKCFVAPYIQWLEDSNHSPNCLLCDQQLSSEQTIRLTCYHIYHLNCLNGYANQLPSNTAPAGYTCPTCQKPMFPTSNANSPVINLFRKLLSDESWARVGLGMPVIESNDHSFQDLNQSSLSNVSMDSSSPSVPQVIHHNPNNSSANVPIYINNVSNYNTPHNDSFGMSTTRNKYDNGSRKSLLDIDEDKYRQKSPIEFISRWLRLHTPIGNRRQTVLTQKRLIIVAIIVFLVICTLVHYFLKFGRESADNDPLLDPRFNPNIRNEVET
ncbi:zinc finger protein-like 1 [Oppia nitens]|uniref:zinc finger protein-like 1 n=1 Tax=Oppia nitens TaxID=1686743 RepID=UPI0023DCC277|nr:zinc finger protein-like 1 [Oppia nitens]